MSENRQASSNIIILEARGPWCRYRRLDTGEEYWGIVELRPDSLPSHEEVFLKLIVSEKTPIISQIAAARKLFEGLQIRPVSDLLIEFENYRELDLGLFPYWQACEILSKAEAVGLDIRIKGAENPTR